MKRKFINVYCNSKSLQSFQSARQLVKKVCSTVNIQEIQGEQLKIINESFIFSNSSFENSLRKSKCKIHVLELQLKHQNVYLGHEHNRLLKIDNICQQHEQQLESAVAQCFQLLARCNE